MVGIRRAVGMRISPTLALDVQKGRAPAAGLCCDIKRLVRTPQHRARAVPFLGGSAPEGQVGGKAPSQPGRGFRSAAPPREFTAIPISFSQGEEFQLLTRAGSQG